MGRLMLMCMMVLILLLLYLQLGVFPSVWMLPLLVIGRLLLFWLLSIGASINQLSGAIGSYNHSLGIGSSVGSNDGVRA